EPGSMTFPIIQRLVDGMILVDERAIRDAIAGLARGEHLMVEGSGAAAIAALADPRLDLPKVGAVVTGRNISVNLFLDVARCSAQFLGQLPEANPPRRSGTGRGRLIINTEDNGHIMDFED